MSLVQDVLIVPTFLLVLALVPLLFPTGRPPTRRWWAVGFAAGAALVLAVTSMAIRPGLVDEDVPSAGANPLRDRRRRRRGRRARAGWRCCSLRSQRSAPSLLSSFELGVPVAVSGGS